MNKYIHNMKQKDLESLQENYQQIEEGFLKRMGTRFKAAKNAVQGNSYYSQELDLIDRHAQDICEDLIKMKMVQSEGIGGLFHALREVISKSIEQFKNK